MTTESAQPTAAKDQAPADFRVEPMGEQPDYELITDLLNLSMEADGIGHYATAAEMENYYSKLPEFSPKEDAFMAFLGDQPVGWVSLQPRQETKGDLILRHHVTLIAEGREPGIRAALIDRIEQRAAARLASMSGDQTVWLEASFSAKQQLAIELIEDKGYHPTRYFFFMNRLLTVPIEDHPMPAGFQQRPITEADYRPIWDAHNQAFSEHWGHAKTSEEHYNMFMEDPLTDPSLWQVAWDGEQVAGMVLNFLDRTENEALNKQRGYTEDIAVLKPYRGQGLAKALITRSMRMFKEMGMAETVLSVDTENPSGALQLYQGLGYQTERKSIVYRKRIS